MCIVTKWDDLENTFFTALVRGQPVSVEAHTKPFQRVEQPVSQLTPMPPPPPQKQLLLFNSSSPTEVQAPAAAYSSTTTSGGTHYHTNSNMLLLREVANGEPGKELFGYIFLFLCSQKVGKFLGQCNRNTETRKLNKVKQFEQLTASW